jgi:hypothetical protein
MFELSKEKVVFSTESVKGYIFLIIENMEQLMSTMKHWIYLLEGIQFQRKWEKLITTKHMLFMMV